MAQQAAQTPFDLTAAVVGALIAGFTAALSVDLTIVGVGLVAAAGGGLGFAAAHLVSSRIHPGRAILTGIGAVAIGGAALIFFQATHPPNASIRPYIDPDHIVLADSLADEAVFPADITPAPLPNTEPVARIQPSEIVNRGVPELVKVSGEGVTPWGLALLTVDGPTGTLLQSGTYADGNGAYGMSFAWRPFAEYGVAGNDGDYHITVRDSFTGSDAALARLVVTSDAKTPPARRWDPNAVAAGVTPGELELGGGTNGELCSGAGPVSEISLRGATPGGTIKLVILDPLSREIVEIGDVADGAGEVTRFHPQAWATKMCGSPAIYELTAIAIDEESGRQAKTTLLFPTRQPGQ